jgi:hypothetical protein
VDDTSRRLLAPLALLAVAVLVLAGCGGSSIDLDRMNLELATVLRLEKQAEGTDYELQVGCRPRGDSTVAFTCVVYALQDHVLRNTWFEQVTCRTPQPIGEYRCVTASGYVLE